MTKPHDLARRIRDFSVRTLPQKMPLLITCFLLIFSRITFSSDLTCSKFLRDTTPLDLQALPNNVFTRKTNPLFTEEEAAAVIRQLNRKDVVERGYGNGLSRQAWSDSLDILLVSKDVNSFSYPDVEKLIGKDAYSRIVSYFKEVVELITISKGLHADHVRCVVRSYSRDDIIIRETSPGVFEGGHRHKINSSFASDPDYKYEEIDATKVEWGPGTIAVNSNGKAAVGDRDHTLFFSDALHGSPDHPNDRLLILITVRTKEALPKKNAAATPSLNDEIDIFAQELRAAYEKKSSITEILEREETFLFDESMFLENIQRNTSFQEHIQLLRKILDDPRILDKIKQRIWGILDLLEG